MKPGGNLRDESVGGQHRIVVEFIADLSGGYRAASGDRSAALFETNGEPGVHIKPYSVDPCVRVVAILLRADLKAHALVSIDHISAELQVSLISKWT